jgi:hypothetical protein
MTTDAVKVKAALKLKCEPMTFEDVALAVSFVKHCERAHRVVLGTNGEAWVVCPADAHRLLAAGYEML